MITTAVVPLDVALSGFHTLTRGDPDQGGAALVSYYLMRGHHWADNTAIADALDLVDSAAAHLPDLAQELRAYLKRRARIDGPGYSVADVGRIQWYRRRSGAWLEIAPEGVPWPGASGWEMLRLRHLRDQGWGHREVAAVLDLRRRLVRERFASLESPASWAGAGP